MNYAQVRAAGGDRSGQDWPRVSKCFHCGGTIDEIKETPGCSIYDPAHCFVLIPKLYDRWVDPALLKRFDPGPPVKFKSRPAGIAWDDDYWTKAIEDAPYERAKYCGLGG
jgi:hypothetical protein